MTPEALTALIDATWPAAQIQTQGPVTLRQGAGGGNRVSAATVAPGWQPADIEAAEKAMAAMGQPPLFMVRAGEEALDAHLDSRGYVVRDATRLYLADARALAIDTPGMTYTLWPPLAIQRELWATGGIDAARLAIMERAIGSKTTILGRLGWRSAGTAFVAMGDGRAMLHALEVTKEARRQGLGVAILRASALWAAENGANELAILVTVANEAANSLYIRSGAKLAGGYRYRARPNWDAV